VRGERVLKRRPEPTAFLAFWRLYERPARRDRQRTWLGSAEKDEKKQGAKGKRSWGGRGEEGEEAPRGALFR